MKSVELARGISLEVDKDPNVNIDYKFRLAKEFFKKFNGKVFEVDYDCNQQLYAYLYQAEHGQLDESKTPELGFFDVVGKKRIALWKALGDLSCDEAKEKFVEKLENNCNYFSPYLLAHASAMIQERKESSQQMIDEEKSVSLESMEMTKPFQESEIRKALNSQTEEKFRLYAQTNYPNDKVKQAKLIEQLQERHFHQYMMFICQMQLEKSQEISEIKSLDEKAHLLVERKKSTEETQKSAENKTIELLKQKSVDLVSTWQNKSHQEFIEQLKNDQESKITVSNGEIVKIRVSASTQDTHIMWEFASTHYDISFGISLEPENANQEIDILSVQRYNCHQNVICGSHRITNKTGTYILKFDNSYSVWRSKDIFYKVYFSSPIMETDNDKKP